MTSSDGYSADPGLLTEIIIKGCIPWLFVRQALTQCCGMSCYHHQPFAVELNIKKPSCVLLQQNLSKKFPFCEELENFISWGCTRVFMSL